MTDSKPLAVEVAEALGCKTHQSGREWHCWCKALPNGQAPHSQHYIHRECCHDREGLGCDYTLLADYPNDPAALWPLIVKYKISLVWSLWGCMAIRNWAGHIDEVEDDEMSDYNTDPAIAVCELIVALGKAGKLEVK